MTNALVRTVFGPAFCDTDIAALFEAPAFIAHMLAFEAAWTRGLQSVGAVSVADAAAALKAMDDFDGMDLRGGSFADGLPVPAFIRALRSGLEDGPARAIHIGSTSQDVIDSAMALTLLSVEATLRKRLERVVSVLENLSERFASAPLMSRTRMQAALPAHAGLRIDTWQRAIEGQIARADAARAEIAIVQIGGPVGRRDAPDGQGEVIARSVAHDLGLSLTPVWHTDRSGPASFGHWLTLVSGSLGKIGQDIALMAQQGVDEIALRGGGVSSAMPHKQNPVAAEAMVTLARFVAGQQAVLAQAMIHEQERSGTAWALEWMTLPTMAEATGAALNHALTLLEHVERIGAPE